MRGGTLALAFVLLLQLGTLPASAVPGTIPMGPSLAYHGPILVQNDLWNTSSSGVTGGSGAPDNPYIIEGWTIVTSSSPAVLIRNTTAAFVVRNLTAHVMNWSYDGVVLDHVRDARVENVTVQGAGSALDVNGSTNVTVIHNDFGGAFDAAMLGTSTRVVLQGNEFRAPVGIGESSDFQVFGNNFRPAWGDGVDIYRSDRVDARYNLFEGASAWGIHVDQSHDLNLSDLFVSSNNGGGVLVLRSEDINLTRIHTDRNGIGIDLTDSTNVTVRGIELWYDSLSLGGGNLAAFDSHTIGEDNHAQGRPIVYTKGCLPGTVLDFSQRPAGEVLIVNCPGVRVSNLSVSGQQLGLLLAFVDGGEVFNNSFRDLNFGGLTLTRSSRVVVHHNFFENVDVEDPTSSNFWNAPYPYGGNWWSDYRGPDQCSGPAQSRCPDPDGIGDVPIRIGCCGAVAVDQYPLMWPWNRTGSPPTAAFAIGPSDSDTRVSLTLDASGSSDPDGGPVQARWDWEGDGVWDTWWSSDLVAHHVYPVAGTVEVRVAVRDRDGYWAVAVQSLVVRSAVPWDYAAIILGCAIAVGFLAWAVQRRRHRRGRRPGPARIPESVEGGTPPKGPGGTEKL